MQRSFDFGFRFLAYRDDDMWVAHCLETDVIAEGIDPKDAIRNLADLTVFQVETALEEGDLKSIFRPAPPEIMYVVRSRGFGNPLRLAGLLWPNIAWQKPHCRIANCERFFGRSESTKDKKRGKGSERMFVGLVAGKITCYPTKCHKESDLKPKAVIHAIRRCFHLTETDGIKDDDFYKRG